jgi:hypothetical protein
MARESTLKVVGFNILAFGAVGVGLFCNYIQPIFTNDTSHLTYLVAATQLLIVILSIYNCFKPQHWIKAHVKFQEANLRLLGLLGTLTGLGIIAGAIYVATTANAGSGDLLTQLLLAFGSGLRTAFNPMMVAVTCWYWTRYLLYFTRHDK